jgi:glucose/arabinose dehydrogenase
LDIVFSQNNTKMFVSVGSASNASEVTGNFDIASPRQWVHLLGRWFKKIVVEKSSEDETERADVLVFDSHGGDRRIYANGIRNCVGMAVNPTTGDLWCSTNERDGLGDNLPPDYITRVRENGFYGWPWYYIGAHQDPRHQSQHSELQD